MIGALKATPTICVQQHDCVATLIGKASSENEGAGIHVQVAHCMISRVAPPGGLPNAYVSSA